MTYGLALIVVAFAMWFTFQFVEPAPPNELTIATGNTDGAYKSFGEQLGVELAQHGIKLNVLETDGSVDNLSYLSSATADVAFLQSGLVDREDYPTFESLGAMYFEPVWLFAGPSQSIERLTDLRNKRVAVGGAGSGTRRVAQNLIAANAMDETEIAIDQLGGMAAVNALKSGDVDALISVASIGAPMIQTLFDDPAITPVSLSRAPAYARREPWLTHLTLPEGVVDLASNIPATSVELLAVNATLVGTEDLHPALRDLLLQAADRVFSSGSLLSAPGRFPSELGSDFPVSAEAARFYEHGPPLLQRYLPFWLANLIDRLKVLALPLVALMLPLTRILPPAYRWSVRKKVYRWYDEVQLLDVSAHDEPTPENLEHCMSELARIENEVRNVEVPLGYAHELYALRHHIELLNTQLKKQRKAVSSL